MSLNDFDQLLEWANNYKNEPVFSFSGPIIVLIVAGILITLLLVWWIVLIFSSTPKTEEEYVEIEGDEAVEVVAE